MENIRIRRAGFAYRRNYEHFLWRYRMVCRPIWPVGSGNLANDANTLLQSKGVDSDGFRIGNTKVFIRNPTTLFMLESEREAALPSVITHLQKVWRGYEQRVKYLELVAVVNIQRLWRGVEQRSHFKEELAAHRIEKRVRWEQAASSWAHQKGALRIQSIFRGWVERTNWKKIKAAGRLQRSLRKVAAKRYVDELATKTFGAVESDGKFGKNAAWPAPPALLDKGVPVLKKMHESWRCQKLVSSLSKPNETFIQRKIGLYERFNGNKPWSVGRVFKSSDYVSSHPVNGPKFKAAIDKVFAVTAERNILFADYVAEVSPKLKLEWKIVVLTEQKIYLLDAKKYSAPKTGGTPYDLLAEVAFSKQQDGYCVLVLKSPEGKSGGVGSGGGGGGVLSHFFPPPSLHS
jgi:hypothetical protein